MGLKPRNNTRDVEIENEPAAVLIDQDVEIEPSVLIEQDVEIEPAVLKEYTSLNSENELLKIRNFL